MAFLSREVVEAIALTRWTKRHHKPGGYWATATEVAEILDVNRSRIGQLVAIGRLPELRTPTRRRLYRRAQIEVIANARRVARVRSGRSGETSPEILNRPRKRLGFRKPIEEIGPLLLR